MASPHRPERGTNGDHPIHNHHHTAAVAFVRAGMPLEQLQQQLGHANIDQTMKYAGSHPDYGDVAPYFDRAGERFAFSRPEAEPGEAEKVEQAAELFGLDAEALAALLSSNNSGNSSPKEASEVAEPEAAEVVV